MSGPIPPKNAHPLPAVGSRLDPTPGSTGVGQPTQEARSDVISVIAEHLRIEKRLVQGEGVRVRVVTYEEETPANVTLRTERIEVEHVPIGRMVETPPPVREEDGVTVIPVIEEVVVTETRLVLREELHVRRIPGTREHQQTVLLRRQRAEVERLPATGMPITDATTATSIKEE